METIKSFERAWIEESESGVEVRTNNGRLGHRHYDVEISKEGGFYVITGQLANCNYYIDKEYDPVIISKVIDAHISQSKPSWLNFFSPARYVEGFCELKKQKPMRYTTTNITIVEELIEF